jgi:biotin carboxyl carrier protein
MKITLDSHTIELTTQGKSYRATIGDETVDVEILRTEAGRLDLRLIRSNNPLSASISAFVTVDGAQRWVTINGRTWCLTKSAGTPRRGGHTHHAAGELVAPMPGQVRAVNVSAGDAVIKGQTLVIVEAMKMEIKVAAPRDGIIASVSVKIGDTVEREQTLIVMSEE